MSIKEKWTKWWNGVLNTLIGIRVFFLLKILRKNSTIIDGYRSIYNKGYVLKKDIPVDEFIPVNKGNWGSARPDMDSVFVEEMVLKQGSIVRITTRAEEETGKDWEGNPSTKPTISGLAQTDYVYQPEGMYSAIIYQDDRALGSWDAWWFFGQKTEDRDYQEVDMIERFFDEEKHANTLTTSVHFAYKEEERNMYNSSIKIDDKGLPYLLSIEFLDEHMKLYYNGLLIFKGLQWKPKDGMRMIVGSGILGNCFYGEVKDRLEEKEYFLEVSEMKKWIKE
jgi:hypothetical protein